MSKESNTDGGISTLANIRNFVADEVLPPMEQFGRYLTTDAGTDLYDYYTTNEAPTGYNERSPWWVINNSLARLPGDTVRTAGAAYGGVKALAERVGGDRDFMASMQRNYPENMASLATAIDRGINYMGYTPDVPGYDPNFVPRTPGEKFSATVSDYLVTPLVGGKATQVGSELAKRILHHGGKVFNSPIKSTGIAALAAIEEGKRMARDKAGEVAREAIQQIRQMKNPGLKPVSLENTPILKEEMGLNLANKRHARTPIQGTGRITGDTAFQAGITVYEIDGPTYTAQISPGLRSQIDIDRETNSSPDMSYIVAKSPDIMGDHSPHFTSDAQEGMLDNLRSRGLPGNFYAFGRLARVRNPAGHTEGYVLAQMQSDMSRHQAHASSLSEPLLQQAKDGERIIGLIAEMENTHLDQVHGILEELDELMTDGLVRMQRQAPGILTDRETRALMEKEIEKARNMALDKVKKIPGLKAANKDDLVNLESYIQDPQGFVDRLIRLVDDAEFYDRRTRAARQDYAFAPDTQARVPIFRKAVEKAINDPTAQYLRIPLASSQAKNIIGRNHRGTEAYVRALKEYNEHKAADPTSYRTMLNGDLELAVADQKSAVNTWDMLRKTYDKEGPQMIKNLLHDTGILRHNGDVTRVMQEFWNPDIPNSKKLFYINEVKGEHYLEIPRSTLDMIQMKANQNTKGKIPLSMNDDQRNANVA